MATPSCSIDALDRAVRHDRAAGAVVLEHVAEGSWVVATGAACADRYISALRVVDGQVARRRH